MQPLTLNQEGATRTVAIPHPYCTPAATSSTPSYSLWLDLLVVYLTTGTACLPHKGTAPGKAMPGICAFALLMGTLGGGVYRSRSALQPACTTSTLPRPSLRKLVRVHNLWRKCRRLAAVLRMLALTWMQQGLAASAACSWLQSGWRCWCWRS